MEQLVADGVRGEVYAHELINVPAGTSGELLDAVAREGVTEVGALGLEPVGAYSVAMADDSEALLLWAIPDWPTWVAYERAWAPDGALGVLAQDPPRPRCPMEAPAADRRPAEPAAHRPSAPGVRPPTAGRRLMGERRPA